MLLEARLLALPPGPGVYLFKDARGEVLYVGKAASLRSRVRSYFQSPQNLPPKVQRMVSRAADVDFMVAASEEDAIILECNLIKKHRPRYNVRLKDDKSYPYLKIDLQEKWPRIYVTRRWQEDEGRYFGPFASAGSVRKTLEVVKKLFPFRSCTRNITRVDPRACIEYDIGRCLGPCIGAVGEAEYRRALKQVILFLEGKDKAVKAELRRRMEEAAQGLEFERAAALRDQLQAVERVTERQKIVSTGALDADAVAFARSGDLAYFQVLFIRRGKLMGQEPYLMEGAQDERPEEVMSHFLQQFYGVSPNIPPTLLLPHSPENPPLLAAWLGRRRGKAVRLIVPRRGEKKELVAMATQNARQGLEHYRISQLGAPDAVQEALHQLKAQLSLPHFPSRVECYDISNIQGEWAVGGMVVFEGGKPRPAHYRRFRIKTVAGPDDYAMLREMLRRRFQRSDGFQGDTPWGLMPDLVLIDGGKGQLSAALGVVGELGLEVPLASLAKEEEVVYLPGSPQPLALPRSSPALLMLQRIRDEAHRFALSYHLKVRHKGSVVSALDSIPGIGPTRKRRLLQKFGSVRGIREAPLEAIAALTGLTPTLARRIKEAL